MQKQVLELFPFTYARRTIACERHPNRNEDSILIDELTGLAAVFDGVGGSAAGEIASQTAARATQQGWKRILAQQQQGRKNHTPLDHCDNFDLCTVMQDLILEADEQVRTEGARRAGTDDLATTVALVAFCRHPNKKGYTMVYAHVGDSRVYLLREQD
ncbi:MAG: protein phosphatase 2C domain-containing protein, partial [Chloroflexi bacterium]|nr:protein phosphatase 2C domain-containing protein [Chloroflexota bacterium]